MQVAIICPQPKIPIPRAFIDLQTISKILERIVLQELHHFCFETDHTSATALSQILHDILHEWDNSMVIAKIPSVFIRAFNTFDHDFHSKLRY
ncbi:hypothetical protein JTB14_015430 [Gonioctena quinquepunctata]|nr:hypothetical protein JTB14_015430 [Gonioctena quinquepunctata]